MTTRAPLSSHNITDPHAHDVLCGRGAGITKHEGNKRWRQLIRDNRLQYTALPRNQRPIIAETIVKAVRSLNPPGRFLSKDAATQLWYDIGDDRATEKTAQAMRDSKKNPKDKASPSESRSCSPLSPTAKPSVAISPSTNISIVPDVTSQCSPKLQRPDLGRLQTDESFCQKMEGFTFEFPTLERDPSGIMCTDNILSEPAAKCSPVISKPAMARNSTFDQRLEQMNFSVPTRGPLLRSGSLFSLNSLDMLAEDEFEVLEESCGMPANNNRAQFFSEIHCSMTIEADGDVVMEETQPTFANVWNHPSHWSI